MKQRPRIYHTESDKALMWDRWQKGESLNATARFFDRRHHSAIQGIFARTGGIRSAPRHRSRLALTMAECEKISRGVVAGMHGGVDLGIDSCSTSLWFGFHYDLGIVQKLAVKFFSKLLNFFTFQDVFDL